MATNSKKRKDHKKKVAARNQRLKEQKSRNEKFQREFIMNLIKQEQEKGLFENAQPLSTNDGPIIDGPIIDGPIIDGPIIDGPIIDGPIIEEAIIESDTEEKASEN
jgi:hypothetical protein